MIPGHVRVLFSTIGAKWVKVDSMCWDEFELGREQPVGGITEQRFIVKNIYIQI